VWGLYGNYDYIAPQTFRVSMTGLGLGTTGQAWLTDSIALQGTVLGGAGYVRSRRVALTDRCRQRSDGRAVAAKIYVTANGRRRRGAGHPIAGLDDASVRRDIFSARGCRDRRAATVAAKLGKTVARQ
jgi:hypothetical protein